MENPLTIDEIPIHVISDILRAEYDGIGKDKVKDEYTGEAISLVFDFFTFPPYSNTNKMPIGSGKMIYPNPPAWLEG